MNDYEWATEKFGVLDHVPLGTFVLRADLVVLFWNSCLEDWTGLSRQQLVGTNIADRFPYLREAKYLARLQDIFEGGPPTIFSSQLHKYIIPSWLADGQPRIQHTTVTAVPTAQGQGYHALFSLEDVTHLSQQIQNYRVMRDQSLEEVAVRKKAEETLQLLKSAIETIPLGVTISNVQGKILYTNQAEATMHGYTVQELLEQDVRILAPNKLWQAARPEQVNEVKEWKRESVNVRRDGSIFPVQLISTSVTSDNEEVIGVITACEDITERKQAEEILRQRNRDLALLNRASAEFISSLDLDHVLANVLESIRHLLDVTTCVIWFIDPTANELVCQHVSDAYAQAMRGQRLALGQGLSGWIAEHDQSVIVADTQTDERAVEHHNQKIRSILGVPLRVRQKVTGVLEVLDIKVDRFKPTDLSLIESLAATAAIAIENARLFEQVRRDAETKAVLLKEVNHRVKNNLTAIIGLFYAEQDHMNAAEQAVYEPIMDDLINRVQGLATVHSMLTESEWNPLLLGDLAQQIIDSALKTLPPDKYAVVDVSPSSVRVTSDQSHNLALVINELATNTIKYTLPAMTQPLHITVHILVADETVRFEFRDNGPGYPQTILQQDTRQFGIGFELIQNIVHDRLGGKLSLRNDNGAVTIIEFKGDF